MDTLYGQNQSPYSQLISSHRIVERKRRHRINRCLQILSNSVPAEFAIKPSGKLEKAEILEMTVVYLKALRSKSENIETNRGRQNARSFQEGYRECMQVVSAYLLHTLGQTNVIRCQELLNHLNTRCQQSQLASIAKLHSSGGHNSYSDKGNVEPSTGQLLPTLGLGESSMGDLVMRDCVSKTSWEEEFDVLKQSLKRK